MSKGVTTRPVVEPDILGPLMAAVDQYHIVADLEARECPNTPLCQQMRTAVRESALRLVAWREAELGYETAIANGVRDDIAESMSHRVKARKRYEEGA